MAYRKDSKKRILFFGDSITEQGMALSGYISLINRQIEAEDSVKKIQTTGSGISGNRVYDLYLRLEQDVLAKSPSIVVVYIGINDVWGKQKSGTGLDIERYEKFYRAIIIKLLAANIKIVLCTPSVIGEKLNGENEQDEDLDMYSHVVRKLATEYQLWLCDVRLVFISWLQENNIDNLSEGVLTTDGVHLNEAGNRLVAIHLWEVLKQVK